jgi:hypothetical protein
MVWEEEGGVLREQHRLLLLEEGDFLAQTLRKLREEVDFLAQTLRKLREVQPVPLHLKRQQKACVLQSSLQVVVVTSRQR